MIRSARRWSLFLFGFYVIDIFHCYVCICYLNYCFFEMTILQTRNKECVILHPYLPITATSLRPNTFLSPQCGREGLTLETSASESLYGGQFTLSNQLIKPNYLVILPPTQHHSFFRNLPPFFRCGKVRLCLNSRQKTKTLCSAFLAIL